MNSPTAQSLDPVTQRLLDYWSQHPAQESTVEAIVEWWLLEQRIQETVEEVRFALSELVKQGFVWEHAQADGRIRYSLNREKEDQVRAWRTSRGKTRS